MITTVQSIDGYEMIAIPDEIVERLGLAEGDVMTVEVVDGALVVSKAADAGVPSEPAA